MSQSGKVDEQSMEEILASIRSSVDTSDVAPPPPPPAGQTLADGGITGSAGDGVSAPMPSGPAADGAGRLQDALSQVRATTQTNTRSPDVTPTPPSSQNPLPAQAPLPPSAAEPVERPKTEVPPVAPARLQDDDLSDLFAEAPAVEPAPASEVEKTAEAPKPLPVVPGVSFGSKATIGSNSAETEKPASVASQIAAATATPAPTPAPSSPPTVTGSSDAATAKADMATEPSPANGGTEAPTTSAKRSPNFDALKTLAGVPTSDEGDGGLEKTTSAPSDRTPPTPSDARPEAPSAGRGNPVVEMHSMAAAMSSRSTAPSKVSPKETSAVPQSSPTSASSSPTSSTESAVVSDEVPTEIMMPTSPSEAESVGLNAKAADTAVASTTGQDTISDSPVSEQEGAAGGTSSRSLEDIVVEMLKPQLQAWLEANMPRIVERALRAEQLGASDKGSK